MRDFIQFLTALCVLAAAQYLALALSVVLLITLLLAAMVHPRRTLQLLATVGLLALAFKAPGYCAVAIGTAVVAITVTAHLASNRRAAAQGRPLLLTDQRDG